MNFDNNYKLKIMNHTKGEWVAMNRTGTGLYKIVSDTLQEVCETQMPYGENLSRPEDK